MTTRAEIISWFKQGVKSDCTHLIVACDTFSHDDYPVWVGNKTPWGGHDNADFWEVYDQRDDKNLQTIMEVYDLTMDMDSQMREVRAFHCPPREMRVVEYP